MKRLEEIKKRLSEATPGPWEAKITFTRTSVESKDGPVAAYRYAYAECPIELDPEDAQFIAHSRQDIEDLVKCVEVMREALKRVSGKTYTPHTDGLVERALAQVEEILK